MMCIVVLILLCCWFVLVVVDVFEYECKFGVVGKIMFVGFDILVNLMILWL